MEARLFDTARLTLVLALSSLGGLAGAASAQTFIPWPAAGAPLCTAHGDALGLRSAESGFSWFQPGNLADTLHLDGVGPSPPTGDCGGESTPVSVGVIAGSVSTSLFASGYVLGCPRCSQPHDLVHVWVSRDPASDRVVIRVRNWPQELAVVRTGPSGALSSPATAANSAVVPLDSAAAVVWTEGTGAGSQVRAQRVGQHGAIEWNAPDGIVLSGTGAEPSVLTLGAFPLDGSVLVVWQDHRGASTDIYSLRLLPDGTPATGWPAGGLALESRSENSEWPRLVAGDQCFFVVWEESGARFGGGKGIVARRLLDSGLPDPAWPDSGIAVTSSTSVDHLEDVAMVAGELVVAWSDTRNSAPGNPNDLYAVMIGGDGARAAGWPAGGVALSTAPGSQEHARIESGHFAWEDTRSGVAQVYVTNLDTQGQRQCCNWAVDGTPAGPASGEQKNPALLRGDNATFVAWEDSRNLATSGWDIYVQAFQSDGAQGTLVGVDPTPPRATVAFRAPAPNPTRGSTRLSLDLPQAAQLRVSVYDVVGRLVHRVASGSFTAGPHEWTWSGADDAGRSLPAGLYHVRAVVDGVALTRSVVRIR